MPVKFKIKKGDRVFIRSGRDSGKSGEVLRILPDRRRALVQGVNRVRRHQKQSARDQGGIVVKEVSIHLSNLAHLDPVSGKPTRIGYKFLDDGRKVRYAKRSGEVLND